MLVAGLVMAWQTYVYELHYTCVSAEAQMKDSRLQWKFLKCWTLDQIENHGPEILFKLDLEFSSNMVACETIITHMPSLYSQLQIFLYFLLNQNNCRYEFPGYES